MNLERPPTRPRGADGCHRTTRAATAWLTLLGAMLALSGQSFAVPADVSIAPSVASLFIGQEKIVEGPVSATQREGNVVRLLLGTPPQTLTVSLVIGLLSKFPSDPERYYLGKTVRVAGTIRTFRRTVEIELHDPALIEVVDQPMPPVALPDTPAVKAPSKSHDREADPEHLPVKDGAVQRRLNTLSERVRVLEEKVQQLESANGRPEEP